jgi:hypothetical protein
LTVGDRNPENAAVAGAPPPMGTVTTAAELFLRNAECNEVAAHFEGGSFTFRELAAESPAAPPGSAVTRPGYRTSVCCSTTRPSTFFWLGARP